MAETAVRGTKRTCQNGTCGARFYDLAKDPIVCPMCSSVFVVPPTPDETERVEALRRAPRVVAPVAAAKPIEDAEADDDLADVETDDDEAVDGDDETFLEEEEDGGGDVNDIIGGPKGGGDEEG